ncbi:MAG TPA: transcription termination/antitermination protein NusG [bacterium]|nr:transcription termination/antitermination protein NusG [bacterium]
MADEEIKTATPGEEGTKVQPEGPESPQYRVRLEDPDVRWYVVHTLTGHEQKVKAAIDRGVAERNLGDYIFNVLVPAEEVTTQTKQGKSVRRKVFFPGYVLVQMKVSEDSWGFIRRTGGVTGFVGSGSAPSPLSDDEVQIVIDQIEGRKPQLEVEFDFEEGDVVNIISGPFANFSGVVEEIYPDRGKCKVMVTIFGRATAVELDISEVDKGR